MVQNLFSLSVGSNLSPHWKENIHLSGGEPAIIFFICRMTFTRQGISWAAFSRPWANNAYKVICLRKLSCYLIIVLILL